MNTLVSRIPLRTRAYVVMVVGFLLVLGALLHTSSSSSNATGKDDGALRDGGKRKKKMSSSELLSHLTTIHHQNAKNSIGGDGNSASAAAVAALELANNNKNSKKSAVVVDNFARQRIRLALANAHRDLQNFNQGIKLSDIERFQNQKGAPSSSSPPHGVNDNNDKKSLASKLQQRVGGGNNNINNNVAGIELKYRWQEAYIHQRAASRPNITLPQHPSNILQRALDLDEALAKKARVTRPLIHQAIEDGDKTRFGDADHNNGDKKKGEDGDAVAIAAGGDAVSARGEVVVPGGILRDDSIFVTIASYRDSECAPTILDLYSKARYPRAISVGIAVQHDAKEDASCIPKEFLSSNENCQTLFGFCPTDNIRTRIVSHKDAKGPTFGRYLGMLMYRGERYIFMMDSHNRFVTHWDFIIVNMYKRLEAGDFGSYDDEQRDIEAQKIFKFPETGSIYRYNTMDTTSSYSSSPKSSQQQHNPLLQDINDDTPEEKNNKNGGGRDHHLQKRRGGRRAAGKHGISKPVLSHYPEAWFHPSDKDGSNRPLDHRSTTTYMCRGKFLDWGVFRLDGNVVSRPRRPQPQGWAAAGFLFARGEILAEVPFDPYLDYVFDGEEITYSIRMWTHGWDIFSPNENILYHYYGRKKAKRFWEIVPPNWTARKGQGETRIKYLLQSVPKDHSQPSERLIPMAGQTTVATSAETPPIIVNNNNSSSSSSIPSLLPLGVSSSVAIRSSPSDNSMLSLEDFYKSAPRQWARDIDVYGLGAERPLQAYYPYAGLNPVTRQFKDGWFCARKS